jgi:Uma2 family endonuclease
MFTALPTPKDLATDTWVATTWQAFLELSEQPELSKARCYYDNGWMRIETMGVGSAHGQDNSIIAAVISLYGTLREINYISFTNTSFRKQGEQECQPDLAYYIDAKVQRPAKNNQPVDVNLYGAPTLAIEIASTTLSDDLGQKRLLYERIGVREYWVVNVEALTVIAFEILSADPSTGTLHSGSRQIEASTVLPGLSFSVIEEALRRSQTEDDGNLNRWLIQMFSAT